MSITSRIREVNRMLNCIEPIGQSSDFDKCIRSKYLPACQTMIAAPCFRTATFTSNEGLVFDPYLWAASRESLTALVAAVFLAVRTQLVGVQQQVSKTGLRRLLLVSSGFFDSRVNGRNAP